MKFPMPRDDGSLEPGIWIPDSLVSWLFVDGEVGRSSRIMAFLYIGIPHDQMREHYMAHPWDPDDLRRCILLLRREPRVREVFVTLPKLNSYWRALIPHWDELVEMLETEIGEDLPAGPGVTAPKTFKRMREIINPVRKAQVRKYDGRRA